MLSHLRGAFARQLASRAAPAGRMLNRAVQAPRAGPVLAALGLGATVGITATTQWAAPVAQCANLATEIAAIQAKLESIEAKMSAGAGAGASQFGGFSVQGKSTIVTGGASGIGLAICELFASKGAKVHILDMTEASASKAAAEITASTGNSNVTGWACDVTDQAGVERVFASIAASDGRIDVLINNAGIAAVGNVVTTKPTDMDKLYAVNIKGVYHCLQAGVNHMLADGKGGAIVNLASIASLFGLKDRFAYGMSKGAVLTMTYSVATDYMTQGIRCNCVAPARVHTPFVDGFIKRAYPGKEKEMFKVLSDYQPIGRMGEPREVAALILYLCSEEASFVTGNCYPIDGGVTYCVDGRE